jgi:fluoride exporter
VIVALCVALSGLGSVFRYGVDRIVQRRAETVFPAGTLVVNTTAAFAIGIVAGLVAHHGVSPTAAKLSVVGFVGGYSTFSTWTFETLALAESGALVGAGLNLAITFLGGLALAAGGYGIGSL